MESESPPSRAWVIDRGNLGLHADACQSLFSAVLYPRRKPAIQITRSLPPAAGKGGLLRMTRVAVNCHGRLARLHHQKVTRRHAFPGVKLSISGGNTLMALALFRSPRPFSDQPASPNPGLLKLPLTRIGTSSANSPGARL